MRKTLQRVLLALPYLAIWAFFLYLGVSRETIGEAFGRPLQFQGWPWEFWNSVVAQYEIKLLLADCAVIAALRAFTTSSRVPRSWAA